MQTGTTKKLRNLTTTKRIIALIIAFALILSTVAVAGQFMQVSAEVVDTTAPMMTVSSKTEANDYPAYGVRFVSIEDENLKNVTVDVENNDGTVAKVTISKDGVTTTTPGVKMESFSGHIYIKTSTGREIFIVDDISFDADGIDKVIVTLLNKDQTYTVRAIDDNNNPANPLEIELKSVQTFIDELAELYHFEMAEPYLILETNEQREMVINKLISLRTKELCIDSPEYSEYNLWDEKPELEDQYEYYIDDYMDALSEQMLVAANEAKQKIDLLEELTDEEKAIFKDKIDSTDKFKIQMDSPMVREQMYAAWSLALIHEFMDTVYGEYDRIVKEAASYKFIEKHLKSSGLDELYNNENIFTEEEWLRLSDDWRAKINSSVVMGARADLSPEDQKIFDSFLKKNGIVAALYIDIVLYKEIYERDAETENLDFQYREQIHDISPNKIKYTFTIPEEFRGKEDFHIIRIHNGVPEILATVPAGSTEITFETDKFSIYVFAHNEERKVEEEIANTMDENIVFEIGAIFVLSALMFVGLKRRRDEIIVGELNK
ncbi:MAG: hypothetical protein GX241_04990 [Ruminococcaceae bacterium]|nr:hypothetical protein [Oscillospiraceae bacterium]